MNKTSILLLNPKYPLNVGNVIRACAAWGISTLRWTGNRVLLEELSYDGRIPREERMRDYRDVDFQRTDLSRPLDLFPNLVPVVVEVLPDAERLTFFEHPENALYIFGPEDGEVSKSIRHASHRFVVIPTIHCLNLSAAVNVVLYDRESKRMRRGA